MKFMMESKFLGRDFVKRPACPFCGQIVEKPMELDLRRPGEMPVGSCPCGAVYACDETGRNIGSALIEALVFACDMDWDLAWNLVPEEDYLEAMIEDYDFVQHVVVPGKFLEGRKASGVLVFIRLDENIQEVAGDGVKKKLDRAKARPAGREPSSGGQSDQPILSKREVEALVQEGRLERVVGTAGADRGLVRKLQRLLYSGDKAFRNRAADALGRVCAVVGKEDPGSVSKLLSNLFYTITDTAAFTWGAFEAIGEIIGRSPSLFGGYVPQIYTFLPDESRRDQAMQTLARISESSPHLLRKHTLYFFPYLKDPHPSVRGHASRLMGNLDAFEARKDLLSLRDDDHEVEIMENGVPTRKTVGTLASESLARI